jgi:hypothetical protein
MPCAGTPEFDDGYDDRYREERYFDIAENEAENIAYRHGAGFGEPRRLPRPANGELRRHMHGIERRREIKAL